MEGRYNECLDQATCNGLIWSDHYLFEVLRVPDSKAAATEI